MSSPRSYRPQNIRLRRVGNRGKRTNGRTNGVKKNLLRFTVLLVVAFAFFQMQTAGDPVEMYLRVVGDAASPAMTFSGDSRQLFIKTTPAEAGVRVWQNDICLGDVPAAGKSFSVSPGRVLLDARGLGPEIRVEITYLGQKHTLDMTEEIKVFDVKR
ncbi:MAG: hypothetical protein FWF88_04650 [Peptococcaceae bacterium]|nr:hypothetical protein [Peptococcaceae bacterium]